MPNAISPQRLKLMKLSACLYFILVSLVIFGDIAYRGNLEWIDFLVVAFVCSPLIVNRKSYYFIFGCLATMFWLCILLGTLPILVHYVQINYEPRSSYLNLAGAFTLGYLFTGVSIFFSLVIGRVGLQEAKKMSLT